MEISPHIKEQLLKVLKKRYVQEIHDYSAPAVRSSLKFSGTPHPHFNRPPRSPRQRRAHAVARQQVLHQAEASQRQAPSHRRAEIKRHPGDLVAPGRDVVGDDPAGRDVVQAGDEAEIVLAA